MTKKQETESGQDISFEEALLSLEEITAALEAGDLPLEKSLELYEKGVKLTTFCNGKLKSAKLKIEELKKSQDEE